MVNEKIEKHKRQIERTARVVVVALCERWQKNGKIHCGKMAPNGKSLQRSMRKCHFPILLSLSHLPPRPPVQSAYSPFCSIRVHRLLQSTLPSTLLPLACSRRFHDAYKTLCRRGHNGGQDYSAAPPKIIIVSYANVVVVSSSLI